MSYDLNELRLNFTKYAYTNFSDGYGNQKTSDSWELLKLIPNIDSVSSYYEPDTYFQGNFIHNYKN
jgi:hypothetical protein